MYSTTTIMGRITRDLELETTPNSRSVCSFSVAVDRRYQKQGEERKADFYRVVAWGSQAEFLTKYFGKGRMVLVQGEMQSRSYTDNDGIKRIVWELIADRISFTGEKTTGGGDAPSNAPTPQSAPPQPQPTPPCSTDFGTAVTDDDYPF